MKTRMKVVLVIGLLLITSSLCAAQKKDKIADSKDLEKAVESRSRSIVSRYTIQPEDVIQVFVWREVDLTRTVVVRPDGKITLPLVQDIQASGLAPIELKKQIEDRLKEFVDSPNVTVMVESINSYKVYFVGRVSNQGVMTLLQPVTILQGLALAGGLEEFAKHEDIAIVRGSDKETKVLPFNYKDVMKGKNLSQNVVLEPGDVVIIP
ncbi:MAG: polysaccharide biosynthesis/export family protein [Acidobacteria bacterium]|nr:polysaccharide biosynthesis/export family protein [Acidobacteriota bacterium]MBI3654987.1 polysaccharide biosynthesis/export family protein [Acidobacteriota bacterium]